MYCPRTGLSAGHGHRLSGWAGSQVDKDGHLSNVERTHHTLLVWLWCVFVSECDCVWTVRGHNISYREGQETRESGGRVSSGSCIYETLQFHSLFFWRTKWDQNHPLSLVNIKTRDHICTTLFSIWQNSQFLRDKHQSSFVYPHLISLCRESKHYYCCREKWRGTRNSIHVLPAAWHYCTPDADWQPWPWSWSCKVQTLVTFLIFVFEFIAMFVYCGKVCKFICSCFFAIFAIYLGITRLP